MKIQINALDVFHLASSYRIVVCCNETGTRFCIVSAGTGESTRQMTGKEVFDYLILGKNPLERYENSGKRPIFVKAFTLNDVFEKTIEGFGKYGRRFVWEEEVTDPEILSYHFPERETWTKKL